MKKLRWQLIIIFLTGLLVGILLLADQPGGPVTSLTPQPARGGVYTEALIGSLQRLNPVLDYANPVDREVNRLIYSGLVRFDARGVPVPDLAETYGIAKDGTVYNFALKPNLRWHDGEPVTADDVVFTIDLIRTGGEWVPEDIRSFWEEIDVIVLSDTDLQFRLPEPFAPFLDYLAFGILPQHILGGKTLEQVVNEPFNLQPVGTGPNRFDQLVVEDGKITGVMLKANELYYEQPPFIEQFIFRYYPDSAAALQAYRNEVVQGIGYVSPDVLAQALAEPDLAVYSGRQPQLSMVLFNLKDPEVAFFEDKEVRQALLKGTNRQWLVDRLLGSQAIVADGPIMPGTWAYYDNLPHIAFDVEAARAQLKRAGYVEPAEGDPIRQKDGRALSFTLLYPDTELHRQIAEVIQKNWSDLQVEVKLEAVAYDQLVNERLANREFQAALVDLNLTRSPDPDPYPFWDQAQATGGQNYSQWDNRNASEYLEQARVTADLGERARLYRNFQVVFSDETPALTLYYPVYTYAVDRGVQGVQMGPLFDSSDRFATAAQWFMQATVGGQ